MRPATGMPHSLKAASCAAGSPARCGLPIEHRMAPRSADDRGIARVQRVEADALALRQQRESLRPLWPISSRNRSYSSIARAEVRRRREPQVAPLGFNDLGPAKRVSRVFDDEARDPMDLGEHEGL